MPSPIQSILKQVLKRATPTQAERRAMEGAIRKSTRTLEAMIKGRKLSYTLAGSFIRDTWMRDKKEFEIFLMFPEDTPREKLEREGLETGKSLVGKMKGSYRIAYAEHPYVRAVLGGFDVDIVPCYKLKSAERIKSAVDRTPFHNKWIAANLKPKQSGEVRLLKQFAKAQGFYGSDTKTMGMSGYLCELLIIRYGSFLGFIEAAGGWKPGRVFLDIEKHHESPGEAAKSARFRDQPLVVIDPVDRNRNVAAALSLENFNRIASAAASFLDSPSLSFFFPPKVRVSMESLSELMKSHGTKFMTVKFGRPDVIDDVLWPQLRRTAQRLAGMLQEHEFVVMDSGVFADGSCFILLELETWKLPKIRKLRGPGAFARERVDEFRKKYDKLGKAWVEKGFWFAEAPRVFTEASQRLKDSLSGSEDELKEKGVASYMASSIAGRGFKILEDDAILTLARKNGQLALFLKKYLEKGE